MPSRELPPHPSQPRRAVLRLVTAAWFIVLSSACGPAGPTGAPAAPRAVRATPVVGGVRVTWLDQSADEDGFVVLRQEAGEPSAPALEIGTASADEQSFVDLSALPDGEYLYGVAAFNLAGRSETVLQEPAEPVSPLPGVEVSLTFDGDGLVAVSGGDVTRVCAADCLVTFPRGTRVTLTAESREGAVFAGWAGDCSGAGTCVLEVDAPLEVEARFRRHVLVLELDGDGAIEATMSPSDDFGNRHCVLARDETCALAYGFAGPLTVSINVVKLDPAGQFLGFEGPCSSVQGMYCLATVAGETRIAVQVVRPPVAIADDYQLREDEELAVDAASGLLANDLDSDDDTLSAVLVSGPTNGELELAANGSFRYEPRNDFNGDDTFRYFARDASGNESAPVTVSLTIEAVNDRPTFELAGDPPDAVGDHNPRVVPGFASSMRVGGGPDEAASQSLTGFVVELVEGGVTGGVTEMDLPTIDSTGALRYVPPFLSSGSATYSVVLKDDGGTARGGRDTSTPRTFTVTVNPVQLTLDISGSGRVARAPDGGGDPTHASYGYGTSVALTALPASNHAFMGWGGACTGDASPCALTLLDDAEVSAAFDPYVRVRFGDGLDLFTVASSPPGITNCWSLYPVAATCDAPFPNGSEVVLTTSATGSLDFAGVTCQGGQPRTSCRFTVAGPAIITISPAP